MAASQLLWKGCQNTANCTTTQATNSFSRKEAARASQCSWNVWKCLSKHDSGFIVSSINIQTFPLLIKGIGSMKCLKVNASYLPPIQFLMQLLLSTPQMFFPLMVNEMIYATITMQRPFEADRSQPSLTTGCIVFDLDIQHTAWGESHSCKSTRSLR